MVNFAVEKPKSNTVLSAWDSETKHMRVHTQSEIVNFARRQRLRIAPRCLGFCALLMLCSCAGTSLKQTWKSPGYQGGPVGTVAVIAVDERLLLRQGFENRFVRQMRDGGQTAMTTFDVLTLPKIKEDKQAAAAQLRAAGAEVVMLLRLVDAATKYREVRAGSERFTPYLSGFEESFGWYDYYSLGFMTMGATYTSLKREFFLETSLFDLKSEKLLWSGLTRTVIKEGMDGLDEMDAVAVKVVKGMRKDGMVR
jgi:hypothetical protein